MSSRRAAIIEEFDDDTDLPLPNHTPLPNTGARGPLLQEIDSDDEDVLPSRSSQAGPAYAQQRQPPFQQEEFTTSSGKPIRQVTDITPYKKWTCVYPIYIDAKRPYGTGQRRVARAKGVWWPLSKDIADASERLGFGVLHEIGKTHPRDWENPGRVRIQWKKEGRLVKPNIKTKKQLLEAICLVLQHSKPENIPKPPYNTTPSTAIPSTTPAAPSTPKGKQPASAKSRAPNTSAAPAPPKSNQTLPIPPEPHPPLSSRVSPYSPALSAGVLIETVKAGMAAQAQEAAAAPVNPAIAQKGKRKVVRVRQ